MNPSLALRELITGFWVSQSVFFAAKLGLADHLRGGETSVDELAIALKARPDLLYRLLRALASKGIFQEGKPRHFSHTPLSELLCSEHPDSLRHYAILYGEESYLAFSGILESISSGTIPFETRFGVPYFEYLKSHPGSQETFQKAMTNVSTKQIEALLRETDFSSYQTVCDVGGGAGHLLDALLEKYPGMQGILFDLVNSTSRPHPRREVRQGSFFETVPAGADAYLLKYILHDWDDEDALKILKNCRSAMKESARLFVVDQIILPGNTPQFAKLADLHLFALLGGKERTEEEFRKLFSSAGFEFIRRQDTSYLMSVLECRPISRNVG